VIHALFFLGFVLLWLVSLFPSLVWYNRCVLSSSSKSGDHNDLKVDAKSKISSVSRLSIFFFIKDFPYYYFFIKDFPFVNIDACCFLRLFNLYPDSYLGSYKFRDNSFMYYKPPIILKFEVIGKAVAHLYLLFNINLFLKSVI
jgi:hypothetical protein